MHTKGEFFLFFFLPRHFAKPKKVVLEEKEERREKRKRGKEKRKKKKEKRKKEIRKKDPSCLLEEETCYPFHFN